MTAISKLSPAMKIALAITLFFALSATIALFIDKVPAFAAYVVGFGLGASTVFVGLTFVQRRTFEETDLQLAAGLQIGKQLAATPVSVKAMPVEVLQSIYIAKAHFPETATRSPADNSDGLFADLRLAA